jgi:hypothetical protein
MVSPQTAHVPQPVSGYGSVIPPHSACLKAATAGHVLVRHLQNPGWLNDLSPAQLRAALADHVTTLMRRYAGRIKELRR